MQQRVNNKQHHMQQHGTPCKRMQQPATTCHNIQAHGKPATTCNNMRDNKKHANSCENMQQHATTCNIRQTHANKYAKQHGKHNANKRMATIILKYAKQTCKQMRNPATQH